MKVLWKKLSKKKNRIILHFNTFEVDPEQRKYILGGHLSQSMDNHKAEDESLQQVTKATIPASQSDDLIFSLKCVKHLKSNAIAIVKNQQMIGAGLGQTSRVDALNQAIERAKRMGFDFGFISSCWMHSFHLLTVWKSLTMQA